MKRLRVVVLLVFGVLILGLLFLLYSRELTGIDFLKQFFLQQIEASLRRKIEVERVKLVVLAMLTCESLQKRTNFRAGLRSGETREERGLLVGCMLGDLPPAARRTSTRRSPSR